MGIFDKVKDIGSNVASGITLGVYDDGDKDPFYKDLGHGITGNLFENKKSNSSGYSPSGEQANRLDALNSGFAAGEARASKYYNPAEASRNLENSRKFTNDQAEKGMDADQYAAEKGNILSAYNRSYTNLGNKLGSQGIRGGTATRARAELAGQANQGERDLAIASGNMKSAANKERSSGAREDISKAEQMRLAEGGLNLNAVSGTQLAEAAATPTRSAMTVICTELYKQNYLSQELYLDDAKHGEMIRKNRPYIYEGYMVWAPSVVWCMQKSKYVTKIVAYFAVPWAKDMAGEYNIIGGFINLIGEPVCELIGKSKHFLRGTKCQATQTN